MVAWKMIGFPGARYNYLDWIDRHNERLRADRRLQDGCSGRPRWLDRLAVLATFRFSCLLRRPARERRQRALAYCSKGFTARRNTALSSRHARPRNRVPNRDRLCGG